MLGTAGRNLTLLAVAGLSGPLLLNAQFNFNIENMPVQIHSFGSQGFLYSNDNNYLTTKSSQGSFAMTDFGVNGSIQITDRFRLGAQLYDRNVGQLGGWHPVLDWASADFKVKDWLGFRAGRVKTVLGLFNDSQDNEFLHTWALLPQSVYAMDLRGAMIAHDGADVYGAIPANRLGHFEYVVYGGARVFDPYGGYPYSLHTVFSTPTAQFYLKSEAGRVIGQDLRWITPVTGLTLGLSHASFTYANHGEGEPGNAYQGYSSARSVKNYTNAFYFDYSVKRLRVYAEFQKYWEDDHLFVGSATNPIFVLDYYKGQYPWYAAVSYRINRRLEVGTYYSRFGAITSDLTSPPHSHLFDEAVALRVDLTSHWDLKVEGHFMDGVPIGLNLRGFYASVNPNGYGQNTNMLIFRTGFAF